MGSDMVVFFGPAIDCGLGLAGGSERVFAKHRFPGQLGPNRHSTPIFTLSFAIMTITPIIGYYDTIFSTPLQTPSH